MADSTTYRWVYDALSDAACVTAVAGAASQEVLAAFGADASVVVADDQVYGGGDEIFASVAAREVAGGVVAVELNGYQGSLDGVLSRLSRHGRAASIFWNVNDDNAFSCACDGAVVSTVDMYDAEDPDGVDLPADLRSLFASAGEDDGIGLWAVGLAMVETYTGIAISEETVSSAGPFHPIPGA